MSSADALLGNLSMTALLEKDLEQEKQVVNEKEVEKGSVSPSRVRRMSTMVKNFFISDTDKESKLAEAAAVRKEKKRELNEKRRAKTLAMAGMKKDFDEKSTEETLPHDLEKIVISAAPTSTSIEESHEHESVQASVAAVIIPEPSPSPSKLGSKSLFAQRSSNAARRGSSKFIKKSKQETEKDTEKEKEKEKGRFSLTRRPSSQHEGMDSAVEATKIVASLGELNRRMEDCSQELFEFLGYNNLEDLENVLASAQAVNLIFATLMVNDSSVCSKLCDFKNKNNLTSPRNSFRNQDADADAGVGVDAAEYENYEEEEEDDVQGEEEEIVEIEEDAVENNNDNATPYIDTTDKDNDKDFPEAPAPPSPLLIPGPQPPLSRRMSVVPMQAMNTNSWASYEQQQDNGNGNGEEEYGSSERDEDGDKAGGNGNGSGSSPIIGYRIQVAYHDEDGSEQWHDGIVVSYDVQTTMHGIIFDSGLECELDLMEENIRLEEVLDDEMIVASGAY